MDYGIAGRTALVVGGSKGMGRDAAEMLAGEGCRVAIMARTQKHIDRAVARIQEAGGAAMQDANRIKRELEATYRLAMGEADFARLTELLGKLRLSRRNPVA